jgi:hypothetical protein
MAGPAEQTLNDLTVTWLSRFIQQQLTLYPVKSLDTFQVESLEVVNNLIIDQAVTFKAFKDWSFVGVVGQPAFTASWVNYGAPYANAGFKLTPDGGVKLHGTIKNGTLGSSAFTLPPGFRPPAPIPFIVLSNGVAGRVDVGADGTVTPISPSSNLSVVLDQIIFQAA